MEPSRSPDLRASDADRERVLSRLRDAHTEGRLSIEDFYERLDAVYEAKTYGELDVVTRDLPPTPPAPVRPPRQDLHAPPPVARSPGLPRGLKAMWATWATAVLVNLVIWFSVAAGSGPAPYFWPIWVAGPWASILLPMTIIWYVTHRGPNGGTGNSPRIGPR